MGAQEVIRVKGGTVKAGDYIFFLRKRKGISLIGNRIFVRHRTVLAVKRVELLVIRCCIKF